MLLRSVDYLAKEVYTVAMQLQIITLPLTGSVNCATTLF